MLTDSDIADFHQTCLSNLCRVSINPGYDKNTFANELILLVIAVENDDPLVCPSRICRYHKDLFLSHANRSFNPIEHPGPLTFLPHGEGCKVCAPRCRGRP